MDKEGPHQGLHMVAIRYLVGVCSFFPEVGPRDPTQAIRLGGKYIYPPIPDTCFILGVCIGATFSHCYHFHYWSTTEENFCFDEIQAHPTPLYCCLMGLQKSLPILDAVITMAQWIRPPRSTFLSNKTQHHPHCSPEWPCNSNHWNSQDTANPKASPQEAF